MSEKQVFVGRKDELEQFKGALENPQGQGILVVGQAGMGKTWLVNKMAQIAANHPKLKCGYVRYEVTPTDSVDSTMALMMDNAFEAGQTTEGSFDGTKRGLAQWKALLNIVNLGDLVSSLCRDPAKNTREQFIERLNLISKRMPENGRAIFIIDPEKYMYKESDQSWAIIVKQLPEKIKFVFAQRNEDALVDSETFNNLNNVICIPEKQLDVLDESSVDELTNLESAKIKYSIGEIKKTVSNYNGHPYAIGAALELLKAGVKLEELPKKSKPIGFAKIQWDKICKDDDAIQLFEAYAVLEVGVPGDVVIAASGLNSTTLKRLQKDSYLKGLLRDEGEGKRIYHAILADYILEQIDDGEKKHYHLRTVDIYIKRLHADIKPDELAAMRLPEHVLVAEGQKAFVDVFINECASPLLLLGALDSCIKLSERALKMVKEGSERHAMLLSSLGVVYKTRGELDKAEDMHKKSLAINEKFGRHEEMAINYGNLGVIYRRRGELVKAKEMFNTTLNIHKKLGNHEGVAKDCGNLGIVYKEKGELYKAEEMFKKGLKIDERFGRLEGMAAKHGNLGIIYQTRGESDKAEEMYIKALAINEKLGRLKGMAIQYGNLGNVYKNRGNLGEAKKCWIKARDLFAKIGMQNELKKVQGWIDGIEREKK